MPKKSTWGLQGREGMCYGHVLKLNLSFNHFWDKHTFQHQNLRNRDRQRKMDVVRGRGKRQADVVGQWEEKMADIGGQWEEKMARVSHGCLVLTMLEL